MENQSPVGGLVDLRVFLSGETSEKLETTKAGSVIFMSFPYDLHYFCRRDKDCDIQCEHFSWSPFQYVNIDHRHLMLSDRNGLKFKIF